jgi:hypothetical protein
LSADAIVRFPQKGDPSDWRDQLLEKLQPFPGQIIAQRKHSRDIPARPCQTCDDSEPYGITARRRDDRDRPRRLFGRECRFATGGHQDVDLRIDQLGGQTSKAAHLRVSPPRLKEYVLSLHVPQLA